MHILILAQQASDVVAGAVLTLVLPLALLIVVLVWWYLVLRRAR